MAETIIPAGDPAAVLIYSHRVFWQALRSTVGAKLMAAGMDARDQTNFVQYFDEPSKGAGDQVQWPLLLNVQGPGVLGDAPIAGQEVQQNFFLDKLTINQQRQAVFPVGKMSQQRVPWSMRDAAKVALANWFKDNIDIGLLYSPLAA